jgi:hypothetical protein
MKSFLNLFLLILVSACNQSPGDKVIKNKPDKKQSPKTKKNEKEIAVIQNDTLEINHQLYIRILKDGKFNGLLSIKGDTIAAIEDIYSNIEFPDINEDGFKDIRTYFFSNTPNQCDNYLFDIKTKTFRLIEDCWLDIQKVKGTDFYFSYERAGCADMNWESYLGKIENNKLIDYGYIYGQGCDFDIKENPQVIEIYKITGTEEDQKKLIKTLPYLKHISEFSDKWDFTETYWKQHYRKFER